MKVGHFLDLGGFPGTMKKVQLPVIEHHGAVFAKTRVESVIPDPVRIGLQFGRENWVQPGSKYLTLNDFTDLRGMSGGPILSERATDSGLFYYELVAIIYEYREEFDILFARPLGPYLRFDGKLNHFKAIV